MLPFKKIDDLINELTDLREQLSAISKVMPDRHFLVDEKGTVLNNFGNAHSELFYGVDNIDQRSVFEFASPDTAAEIQDALDKFLRENRVVTIEVSQMLSEIIKFAPEAVGPEERQWFEIMISPVELKIDEKRTAICSIRNITKRKIMEEQLQKLAATDPLTSLYNRRHIMAQLQHCYERYLRYGTHTTILMLDIDLFKQVNDTFGHDVGDLVLIELSSFLKKKLRKLDIIGRLGGEEFLIIMPDSSLAEVESLSNRLITGVSELKIPVNDLSLSFTVSGGLSEITSLDSCVDDFLKRADKGLYHSKENGRNQIYSYPPEKDLFS